MFNVIFLLKHACKYFINFMSLAKTLFYILFRMYIRQKV